MKKRWQILDSFPKDFEKDNPDYNRVVLQLLYSRGLKDKKAINDFFYSDLAQGTYDPYIFDDMQGAVNKIIEHIKAKNKIVVYGDYDADGVCAAALLIDTLATLKANVDVYIPYRVTEGYGLNKRALEKIKKAGTDLVITVDGGIRNQAEVEYAKKLQLEIIITDHHLPPESEEDLPDCLIINPWLKREKYYNKDLSGVGVAFKLVQAIISKTKLAPRDRELLKSRVMDLLAIGTITDCVTLFCLWAKR